MDEDFSGSRIRELRQERGMTADELGRLIGKNRATVYRYEDGSIDTIPFKIVKRIAEILEVRPSYLIGLSNTQEQKEDVVVKTVKASDKYAEVKAKVLDRIDNCTESELAYLLQTLDLLEMRSRIPKDNSIGQDSSRPQEE